MPMSNMFSEILCSVGYFSFFLCGGFDCLTGAQTEVPGLYVNIQNGQSSCKSVYC